MAGFRTHITVSGGLGVAYGAVAVQPLGFTTEAGVLAALLTGVGGMLPDVDSDNSVPIREMSHLASVFVPMMMLPRLIQVGLTRETILATLLVAAITVRFVMMYVFRRLTVHRGMFHSIPAMLIAGLAVYLAYGGPDRPLRWLLAGSVMLGFLSHLVLDEVYAVDWQGLTPRLKPSAGSALKLYSRSRLATATCYALLGSLLYLTLLDHLS
ncbi:MAG: metal-dependent hydrolase [Gemmataceae bacterium]|nr:metal-dependent hydrolase [Gemmataceae bacterium]MCS7269467.1 metal-dependent hydrolase [Gemmataceae bacterium]MDW8243952.1 metal-dependent hydrolase [Thermogemmata sp.]